MSFLNLDAPYLREPTSSSGEIALTTRCFRRKPRGVVKAEVQVTELGILPGETIRVHINFENTSKRRRFISKKNAQKCVLLSLCQQLDFQAQNTANPRIFSKKTLTTAVHSQACLEIYSSRIFNFRERVKQVQEAVLKPGL